MLYSFLRFRPKRKASDLPFEIRPYVQLSGDDPVEVTKESVRDFRDTLLDSLRSMWAFVVSRGNQKRGVVPRR
jgi:hypothetical protein